MTTGAAGIAPWGMGGRQAAEIVVSSNEVDQGYQMVRGKIKQQLETRYNSPHRQREVYNVHTLLTDLKSCSSRKDLQWGRRIHAKAVERQYESNMYVVTALIRMYAKCGSMVDARRVFESIQKPNVVFWTALLLGYAENGDGLTTLNLFSRMKVSGCLADAVTYIAVLKACTSLAEKRQGGGQGECLKRGREIHSEIGCNLNLFVKSSLIGMYGKCGSMVDARLVFESIKEPNVVCWNTLLSGYAENGERLSTLKMFSRMKSFGCVPDSMTYIAAVKACTFWKEKHDGDGQGECLKWGREIHSEIGHKLDIFLQNALIDMYAKCGSMAEACCVFESIQKPNVVSWTTLLLGYAENGDGFATLKLFSRMKTCECVPDAVTYVAALKACTSLVGDGHAECLKRGREIHSEIGSHLDIFVQNTLIDLYIKCGSMVEARSVFDNVQNPNVVSWTALLMGYVDNGDGVATLDLFSRMRACGCAPDSVTYIAALRGCSLIGALALGRKFHLEINEFTGRVVTCLIDFYAKCGSIVEAHGVFDTHCRERDVSTWTALLAGYGSLGDSGSVFNLFESMQRQGFHPNAVTFVCILSCCSHAGLVEKAKEYFEAMPVKYGVDPTDMHYTCMVDVLGRANKLSEALVLVRRIPCNANALIWMTLLGACRKWKNFEIGRTAFQALVDMDKSNAIAYVLMAQIYSSKDMWEEQGRVLEARTKLDALKHPEQAYRYDDGNFEGEVEDTSC